MDLFCSRGILVFFLVIALQQGDSANVCYQCASSTADSSCEKQPHLAAVKNCSLEYMAPRESFCVTQTVQQKGITVAIIRDCSTEEGWDQTHCQLEENPMTGFAVKCTATCRRDLCNTHTQRHLGISAATTLLSSRPAFCTTWALGIWMYYCYIYC